MTGSNYTVDSLQEIECVLESSNIQFEGVRYGPTDALKQNFDATIGTIEFLAFVTEGKIMSDEEAAQIKLAIPQTDYEELLDSDIKETVTNQEPLTIFKT